MSDQCALLAPEEDWWWYDHDSGLFELTLGYPLRRLWEAGIDAAVCCGLYGEWAVIDGPTGLVAGFRWPTMEEAVEVGVRSARGHAETWVQRSREVWEHGWPERGVAVIQSPRGWRHRETVDAD